MQASILTATELTNSPTHQTRILESGKMGGNRRKWGEMRGKWGNGKHSQRDGLWRVVSGCG